MLINRVNSFLIWSKYQINKRDSSRYKIAYIKGYSMLAFGTLKSS